MRSLDLLLDGVPARHAEQRLAELSGKLKRPWIQTFLLYGGRTALFVAASVAFTVSSFPLFLVAWLFVVVPCVSTLREVSRIHGWFLFYQSSALTALVYVLSHMRNYTFKDANISWVLLVILAFSFVPLTIMIITTLPFRLPGGWFSLVVAAIAILQIAFVFVLKRIDVEIELEFPANLLVPTDPRTLSRNLLGAAVALGVAIIVAIMTEQRELDDDIWVKFKGPVRVIGRFIQATWQLVNRTIQRFANIISAFLVRIVLPQIAFVLVALLLLRFEHAWTDYHYSGRKDVLFEMELTIVLGTILMLFCYCLMLNSRQVSDAQERTQEDLPYAVQPSLPQAHNWEVLCRGYRDLCVSFLFLYPATIVTLFYMEVEPYKPSPLFYSMIVVILIETAIALQNFLWRQVRGMEPPRPITRSWEFIDTYWFIIPLIVAARDVL